MHYADRSAGYILPAKSNAITRNLPSGIGYNIKIFRFGRRLNRGAYLTGMNFEFPTYVIFEVTCLIFTAFVCAVLSGVRNVFVNFNTSFVKRCVN